MSSSESWKPSKHGGAGIRRTDELDKLRPDVREAVDAFDIGARIGMTFGNKGWNIIRAELLRLAGVEAQLGEVCSIWTRDKESAVRFLDRAEKAEAELAALKTRIEEAPVVTINDSGHIIGDGYVPSLRGKHARLVVEG